MAVSDFPTVQYSAEHFVESAGAILLKLSSWEVCIVERIDKQDSVLPKGRRNIGESRSNTALREVYEETGFTAQLLPVCMRTRAPSSDADANCADEPRWHEKIVEPFLVTQRQLATDEVKFIWWYIAVVDEEASRGSGESEFRPIFVSFGNAERRLTFESDRAVLRKAISILKDSKLVEDGNIKEHDTCS